MSALSIRRMNFTLQTMAHIQAAQDSEWYANLPEEVKADRTHYWHLQRQAKRKRNGKIAWIYMQDLYMTKSEVARFWNQHYRGQKEFRLKHLMSY